MGVFSRTMLMLTMAWLVGLIVSFLFLSMDPDPSWRDKYIAEANIRRAIAYRYVEIRGGMVADRHHEKGLDSQNQPLSPENLGSAPYGLPDENQSGGSTDALPGAQVPDAQSLIAIEQKAGEDLNNKFDAAKQDVIGTIATLRNEIADKQRERRAHEQRLAEVREASRLFAAQMRSYRFIIASFQQKVFNLDFEIQRLMIERDALVAELAQISNDTRRLEGQQETLENTYYGLTRRYDSTIKVLAHYEAADKNLRRLAEYTGRGWLRGKVVGVGDDPRTGVLSISIGSQDKVQEGQVFSVYRNGDFLAKMVVETVKPNTAVGRLLPEFRGRVFVTENDNVKTAEPFGGSVVTTRVR